MPLVEPGFWPPAAAAGPEQPPVATGPGPNSQGNSNDAWLPDDMMGFGGMGGMGAGGFGGGMNPSDSFRYSVLWFPKVPVQGQATDLQMVGENLSFTHPLWKDSLNALSLSGGVRNELIETDAILPDTGQPLPSELWGVNLGLRYNRQLEDGWITGGGVSIGSASDHPFATIHEMNVGMNAMLRIPQGEHNAWLFTLAYSPMGELNFPVPGVAFSYNPSPQFHANIGLPLMVMWRPTDDWQFQASYMLLRTIHIKAQYRFTDSLRAFAAYDWSNESYSLLDRPELNDRFFIYDQRASMGLQVSLCAALDGVGLGRFRLRPLHVRGHVVLLQQFQPGGPGQRTVRRLESRDEILRDLQEVHHRIALLVAVSTLEMDRHIAVGTHGNGVSAPKICRFCRGDPGSQLASGVGMRSDQCPNRQEMGVIEDNRAVDAGQFDQLPLPLDGTGLLADGDVFDRTSDQNLSAGPVREPHGRCVSRAG